MGPGEEREQRLHDLRMERLAIEAAELKALREIAEAARAVDKQWRTACAYDTHEILVLRKALSQFPKSETKP